jgi:hypothetical protein
LQHFGLLFSENVVVLESGYWNFLQKCKRLGLSFIFFVDPNSFEKGKKTDRSLPSRVLPPTNFLGFRVLQALRLCVFAHFFGF